MIWTIEFINMSLELTGHNSRLVFVSCEVVSVEMLHDLKSGRVDMLCY